MAAVNPARGEVAITLDGVPHAMRLTLGALAALEERLACGSLVALAEKFESGAVTARDLIALLSAGIGGAGTPVSEEALAEMEIDGGATAALRAGLALLAATFRPADG